MTPSEKPEADRASDTSEKPEAVVEAAEIDTAPAEIDTAPAEIDTAPAEIDTAPAATHTAPAPASPVRRALAWCRRHIVVVVAAALVVASALAAGSVYWWLYRPDVLTGAQAREQAVAAAKEGIEAALSYSPDNLDEDLATAKSHLTGAFLEYYSDFTEKVVTPAAKQKGVKTEANVARAAVAQMRPGNADVLVFVNQVTTSKDRPTPALATSTVMVTMVKSGGQWLIAEFNPV